MMNNYKDFKNKFRAYEFWSNLESSLDCSSLAFPGHRHPGLQYNNKIN